MKILHLIDSGGLYGAEVMLLNLMQEQVAKGFSPVLCSIGALGLEEKPIETEAKRLGLSVHILRMKTGFSLRSINQLLTFARDNQFEIMHSHGYKANILLGIVPKKIRQIPLLCTLHGWTNTGKFRRITIYEWLDSKIIKLLDAVVLVNQKMLQHRWIANRKIPNLTVIDNGIPVLDDAELNQSLVLDNDITQFSQSGFVVGAIGRLSNEKGFEYLLDAFNDFRLKVDAPVKLLLIGEGYKRVILEEKIVQLGLTEHVKMPGYVKNAEQYLTCFNIFALSSLTEGLPITLLEAMRRQVPVVATSVGGIPDVLDHGSAGMLVASQDVAALSKAFLELYGNAKLVEQYVASATVRLKSHYSSEIMTNRYTELYKTLLK